MAQIVQVLEVQLAESLKRLQSDIRLGGAKVSKNIKKALEDFHVVAHLEAANCVALLSSRLADVRKVDAIFGYVAR